MAIDWNNIGFPGTRVFEGMAAAANAGRAMSADTMDWMQKRDHRANQPVRDLQRQLAVNELQTELPLAEAANKAILGIQKHAKSMSTTQGFADYMNAENPDQAGGKYKVVKDASGVERIDLVAPDGSLLTSMPGYKGQSALKFAMRNYAMNPARLREKLWDMDFKEGDLASRLAMNEQRMDARMQEQLMRMEMMGMKNQMALMGLYGKGSKDQDVNPYKNATDIETIRKGILEQVYIDHGIKPSAEGGYVDDLGQPVTDIKKIQAVKDAYNKQWKSFTEQAHIVDPTVRAPKIAYSATMARRAAENPAASLAGPAMDEATRQEYLQNQIRGAVPQPARFPSAIRPPVSGIWMNPDVSGVVNRNAGINPFIR